MVARKCLLQGAYLGGSAYYYGRKTSSVRPICTSTERARLYIFSGTHYIRTVFSSVRSDVRKEMVEREGLPAHIAFIMSLARVRFYVRF